MKSYKLEIIKKEPHTIKYPNPLIFVHGAAGGAWYFSHFMDYFSEQGYLCYAFSLRGHGRSEGLIDIHTFTLDDYVNDLHHVVKSMKEKPIVIGHSMGGAVTQKFIDLYQVELKGAILLSSAKANGIDSDSPLGLFFSDARSFLRNFRKKPGFEKFTIDDLLNETVFSHRFDHEKLKDIKRKLTVESNIVKKDLLKPFIDSNFQLGIPVYVIGSRNDHIITSKDLEETAHFFKTKPIFLSDVCHFLTIDPDWLVVAMKMNEILLKMVK
ncbi:MAG: alpha/beta hydrolase [Acholeplasmataceae bacterium]|jgi:pimeloyl-ACP methyl ester carboxylesterase|nr:alpha/beta hydrolase [Acholeplasmataceae bacterium]